MVLPSIFVSHNIYSGSPRSKKLCGHRHPAVSWMVFELRRMADDGKSVVFAMLFLCCCRRYVFRPFGNIIFVCLGHCSFLLCFYSEVIYASLFLSIHLGIVCEVNWHQRDYLVEHNWIRVVPLRIAHRGRWSSNRGSGGVSNGGRQAKTG